MEQPEGAWYLRGDIGIGILSQVNFVFEPNPLNGSVDFVSQHASHGDTVFFDAGVGYEFNNWLRFDVTAEYRTKSRAQCVPYVQLRRRLACWAINIMRS